MKQITAGSAPRSSWEAASSGTAAQPRSCLAIRSSAPAKGRGARVGSDASRASSASLTVVGRPAAPSTSSLVSVCRATSTNGERRGATSTTTATASRFGPAATEVANTRCSPPASSAIGGEVTTLPGGRSAASRAARASAWSEGGRLERGGDVPIPDDERGRPLRPGEDRDALVLADHLDERPQLGLVLRGGAASREQPRGESEILSDVVEVVREVRRGLVELGQPLRLEAAQQRVAIAVDERDDPEDHARDREGEQQQGRDLTPTHRDLPRNPGAPRNQPGRGRPCKSRRVRGALPGKAPRATQNPPGPGRPRRSDCVRSEAPSGGGPWRGSWTG